MNRSPRILVVRRDNIGDLICTTPLLHGLRQRYPSAYIAVLASSYNTAVLDGNPDVDAVHVYLKRQQKSLGLRLWQLLLQRWRLERELRRQRFDYVLLANGGLRYARKLGGKTVVGFRERDNPDSRQPDIVVPLANRGRDDHEVRKMALLGEAIGVPNADGRTWLFPDAARAAGVRQRLLQDGWQAERPTVAVHISSRQPVQRWTEEGFIGLIREIVDRHGEQVLLLWSPGAENDPMHPGDDEKAARIVAALPGLPVFPCATACLQDLVATLSLADCMACSDGGAMHVAAALGKPILCFFGHSNAVEWHPWKVPHVLLQPESRQVKDISLEEALAAFAKLRSMCDDTQLRLASEPAVLGINGAGKE